MPVVYYMIFKNNVACLKDLTDLASSAELPRELRDLMHRCPDGSFGYKCKFRCRCRDDEPCDKFSGSCYNGCAPGFWGPGCQLSNMCFYNGQPHHYAGRVNSTKNLFACQRWDAQIPHRHSYGAVDFPDGLVPENFCRTTKDSSKPWCYTTDHRKRWDNCQVNNCNCPAGRFGDNCERECHCRDQGERCDSIMGICKTKCGPGWTGFDCQTRPTDRCRCRQGYFNAPYCEPVTPPRILGFTNEQVNQGQSSVFNCSVAAFPTPRDDEIRLVTPSGKHVTLIQSNVHDGYTRSSLFLVTDVQADERFSCVVRAVAGETSITRAADLFRRPMLISPPTVLKEEIGATEVPLTWPPWSRHRGDSGDGPVMWYSVFAKGGEETEFRMASVVPEVKCHENTMCNYTLLDLTPNTNYVIYVSVRRQGDTTDGPASPMANVKTKCAEPTEGPTIISVDGGYQVNKTYPLTRLLVEWQDSLAVTWGCDNIRRYQILVSSGDEPSTLVTHVAGRAHKEFYIRDLEPVLSAPRNLRMTRRTSESLTFTWERPQDTRVNLTTYTIIYWKGFVRELSTKKGLEWESAEAEVEYTLGGLEADTSYNIQIQAVNSAGAGEYRPGMVTRFRNISRTLTSVMLKWDEPEDSAVQILFYYDDDVTSTSVDYYTATREGLSMYVAAQLTDTAVVGTFVVGDNRTYGGFTNVPLESDVEYDIWLCAFAETDTGIRKSTTKAVKGAVERGVPTAAPTSNHVPVIVGVLIVFIVMILVVALLLFMPNFGPTIIPEPELTPPSTPIDTMDVDPLLGAARSGGGGHVSDTDSEPVYGNIGFEILSVRVEDLWDYVKNNKCNDCEGFKREYKLIPCGVTALCEAARKDENKSKNRYGNIGYSKEAAYIAAQGPTKETLKDIWRMVWQEKSRTIIMLTNPTETGKEKEVRLVKQFHYTAWPDHGVPAFSNSLLLLRQKIRSHDNLEAGPQVIHCSAGVGRTGSYIAIDVELERAKTEGKVDVHNFVQLMRTQRINMVQTLDQYIFVYDCLLEALISGDTLMLATEYKELLADMCQFDNNIQKTRLEEQFDSYTLRDGFILTQMPLPNTVIDFWRLVYDHCVSAIVMLNDLEPQDETVCQYWSLSSTGEKYGPFIVETTAEIISDPSITIRDFTITNTYLPQVVPKVVRQFQFHRWSSGSPVPSSKLALFELIDMVDKSQKQAGDQPVLVHCIVLVERLKLEKEIDVFQTVKQLRQCRPHLVDNLEQYRYCHEIVLDYINKDNADTPSIVAPTLINETLDSEMEAV
ncbi:PTPRT-like protein [Mya arenaria]|uniref:PTPRT-like protein n=1 Tax=Mya arenaria TaxID=6604 RepID=A0ABY7FU91_MYAAR|nr:PTPRT-like protein [Mya arenaria]